MTQLNVNTLINQNSLPIFERLDKFNGLTMETDVNNNVYVNAPLVTYFHELPESGSLNEFYNLTEKVTQQSLTTTLTFDQTYQSFNTDDSVNVVLFDKGSYNVIGEHSTYADAYAGGNVI